MRIEVYHIKPGPEHEGRRFREHGLSWEERRSWYAHVATLDVPEAETTEEALDCAWGRTQHGPQEWTQGSSVASLGEVPVEEVRSSSIGDVFVVSGSVRKGGVPYQVDLAGFSDISRRLRRARKAGADGKVPFYEIEDGEWPDESAAQGDRGEATA